MQKNPWWSNIIAEAVTLSSPDWWLCYEHTKTDLLEIGQYINYLKCHKCS